MTKSKVGMKGSIRAKPKADIMKPDRMSPRGSKEELVLMESGESEAKSKHDRPQAGVMLPNFAEPLSEGDRPNSTQSNRGKTGSERSIP